MTIKRLLMRISVLCLCVCFTQLAFSQTKIITGTINDDKGAPIQGVSVAVKGAKGGTTTDANGAFSLTVGASARTLVISSVGFSQQEVSITDKTSVTVSLVSSTSSLNDVVVIGYGTVRRKDATGSLTTISAKEFNQGVITTPDQLLQNKVSGLEVTSASGQPGAETTVRIRGNSSIQGRGQPLYVIDGVILDGGSVKPGTSSSVGNAPGSNPLLWVNNYDIADITILKDASATAIYGSRGANGVIVITTKKGTSGPVKLEAYTSIGFNIGYMKKFNILDYGQFVNALHKYNSDSLATVFNKGAHVDPLKDITQSHPIQNYDIALSGGNENGKFRASFLASRTPGFIESNNLDKYIGSFYGAYKFLDHRLSIDFGVTAGRTNERNAPISNNAGSTGNEISAALQWNPTSSYYNKDGSYLDLGNSTPNPVMLLRAYNDKDYVNSLLGYISAAYKILPSLEYKFLYSINQQDGSRYVNLAGYAHSVNNGSGAGSIAYQDLTSQVFDHTLNFNSVFGKNLKFHALAGFEYWKSNSGGSGQSAVNFDFNNNELIPSSILYTDVLSDGSTQNPSYSYRNIKTEIQSYFARVEFNYKDKLYLTGSFRADGSSKFGSNNKYAYFPSVGAKWNLANEDFMKDNHVFSGLALRGSWGLTGSQNFPAGSAIDQYQYISYQRVLQVTAGNKNLKWEQTAQYDFGVDFSIMNNRISGSIDYYNKDLTNILFENNVIQPGPAAVIFINLPGHLINKGVEFSISATVVEHKDFTWDISANFSTNNNKLTKFYAPGTTTPLAIYTGAIDGQGVSGTQSQIITNNQPVDEFYLKKFGGYAQNGAQIVSASPSYSGNPNPTYLFGGSTSVRYKKLTLTINGGGSGGFKVYNNTATSVTNLGGILNQRNIDYNAYKSAENPNTTAAKASTRFLEDGTFFKLRNASIAYNLGNIGDYIKDFSLFVSGSNLFVLTSFSGFDPEVNIDKAVSGYPSTSIEYIPYPTPRSFMFGLKFGL